MLEVQKSVVVGNANRHTRPEGPKTNYSGVISGAVVSPDGLRQRNTREVALKLQWHSLGLVGPEELS